MYDLLDESKANNGLAADVGDINRPGIVLSNQTGIRSLPGHVLVVLYSLYGLD